MTTALSRRAVLRGTAGAAIALPMLEAMGPSRARAAGGPSRFILFAQPLGTFGEHFFPLAPGTPLHDLRAGNAFSFRSGKTALDDPNFALSPVLTPLAEHKSDIVVVEGFNNAVGNHPGYGAIACGTQSGNGISIDQDIARKIGQDTKFASLQFGSHVSSLTSYSVVSWYGPGKGAPAESNPATMFARLFSDVRTDPEAAARVLAQRKSILDTALEGATALGGRLGTQDRTKLEQYLESIRDVERRLSIAPGGAVGCAKPEAPREGRDYWNSGANFPIAVRTQIDLLTMAAACNLTRVLSMQPGAEANNITFPFLSRKIGWHDLSHQTPAPNGLTGEFVKLNQWMATQFAYLLGKLKQYGLLEDSLVLWTNSMQNANAHDSSNVPLVLAGRLGGRLRTGRHFRIASPNRYVNDLYVTIARAFGTGLATIGDAAKNKGAVAGLFEGT